MAASLTKTLFTVVAVFIIIETTTAANFNFRFAISDAFEVASKTYDLGDKINLAYDKTKYYVAEVSKPNFDSCNTDRPMNILNSGDDTIPLNSLGRRYFICRDANHCTNGMKLQIDTTGTLTTTPPPESGIPVGPSSPSAAGRRLFQGKVAAACLIGVGVMMMLAV